MPLALRLEPSLHVLARVGRETGARVALNLRLAGMSFDVHPASLHDARRIELVCNGLPLWHRHQLAVDATLVSPIGRHREPRTAPTPMLVAGVVLAECRQAQALTILPGARHGTLVPPGFWHRNWVPLGT